MSQSKNDLQMIRQMMERSSKFLSLSGLSGIFAGSIALTGAMIAYGTFLNTSFELNNTLPKATTQMLVITGFVILITALAGALFFSYKKARKSGQKFWNTTTRLLLTHLFIPLIAGGIFTLLLLKHGRIELIPSATLIFYGLALVNAGKYTFGEIHYLGLSQIVLGLIAAYFLNYSLLFWSIGFGVLHIIYGWIMYNKYDRKDSKQRA